MVSKVRVSAPHPEWSDFMPRSPSRLQQNVEKIEYIQISIPSPNDWTSSLSFPLQQSYHSSHLLIMIKHVFRKQLLNTARTPTITKRYAHAPVAFNWEDPLDCASLFTQDELAIQETAHSYCQERMLPRVLGTRQWVHIGR